MTKEIQTITQRLSRIQKALKAPKDKKNTFGNYNFRNAEQILESVKSLLEDGEVINVSDEIVIYGVNPSVREFDGDVQGEEGIILKQKTKTTYGERFYIKATASFMFEDKVISSTGFAREPMEKKGMDASQITGATSSYAKKYALSNLFAIDDSKDDPDATNKHEDSEKPKNWKSVQTNICNEMEMCKSMPELDALMERHNEDIQQMPNEFADFINDKYEGLKEGGFPDKPKVKFASVKDALDGWEKMTAKVLTFESIKDMKEWIVKITPYLDELDRVLTAEKYKNDKGQTPRQELESNIDFHAKTLLSRQG